jgi:serine/threonine protein kinase/Tfp pilus assembly protein PilF
MMPYGISDSIAGVSESPAKCRQCGATTRLGNGLCLSCTLREGLEGDSEASRESFEAILAEDEVRDTHWRVGNYEILEEIGRGGMGVIYRARQRHSRRIVALKRIVSYHADSRETLERFRREAEAAASLDHPNILPIYEVGQGEDGLPFFSMKYAAAGSLQKAGAALRNELRECVRLMAKVAHAVQYAHEHGVLHRDLKPGNILLDGHGEPFVTDFGLAKWLDTTTDLTRSLAIFGTPGYIAPEQAKGPAAKLTPVADVYSLGAILFDLFTGRPPFLGEHALAVIQQASEKPAPKLRSLSRSGGIDRDLETICARCLEREPQARYRSAGDLAIDLERWLEGRPIIARRVSPPVRAWRWSKRNPKLAVATAAAFCSAMAAAFLLFSHNSLPLQSSLDSRLRTISIPEKSIAVLPFENRSRDPDNAYLADGIQDEILTRLSKIADLKVISRTSTQHYKSAPTNLPEIARELGVARILEGSVQKAGDAVRVNVQLIKAADDSHLWADTFDHKLTDIFSVESDVAKAIAEQLQAKLTGREEQVIAAKPTDNPEAYDAYLRGLAYSLKTANTSGNALGAQKYLKEAVRLDPKFALAWALLSYVEARGYITQFLQPTVALREEAQQAAERALTLQPNLGEAILAKGFYYYACLKDYDTAVRYFEQARPLLPNSSRIPESLAYVTRKQGQWDQSESYFNEAERLDPRNVSLLTQHALSYKDRRLFPEAWRKFEQILNITPDDVDTIVEKAVIAQAEGDLQRASALLASVQPAADDTNALETQAYQSILERRPAQIMSRLKDILVKPDPALGFYKGELRFWLGWAQNIAGDHDAAQESWRQARSELEPFLKEQPENHILLGDLALTDMSLGDKVAALALSERAMAALPIEKDAVRGPAAIEFFARAAANVGEADRAIAALQKLMSTSYSGPLGPGAPLTPALLRLDPMFYPLRNDPRFEKIVEQAKQPVALK